MPVFNGFTAILDRRLINYSNELKETYFPSFTYANLLSIIAGWVFTFPYRKLNALPDWQGIGSYILYYCSICLPKNAAAVLASFTSRSLNLVLASLVSIITEPIASPSLIIGVIT